jgi:hypothetical protein
VFTFVRIKRASGGFAGGGPWTTDAPDSDLNLAYRLQQMTSIKVNPDGLFLRLTDKELPDYPFIYMVEPGSLSLDDEEVAALRKYLLNGGFLWLDDFWGDSEWNNGVQIEYLNDLEKLFVTTKNTTYEITVISGTEGDVLVRGGQFFPETTAAQLSGASLGYSFLKLRGIYVGFCMELFHEGRRIITSPVVRISDRLE